MTREKLVDLHTHSSASDGTDTPAALVKKAAEKGLVALALTDHDTMAGLAEAARAAAEYEIEFIPGCEISTKTAEGRFHVLALWLPFNDQPIRDWLTVLHEKREIRNRKIIQRLQELGVDITYDELLKAAEGTPGRPHLAQLLFQKGVVSTRDEAFTHWLGKNGAAYVPKEVPTTEEAVAFFAAHGAAAVLAHPMLEPVADPSLRNLLLRLKDNGLAAIEAWHSAHTPGQISALIGLANSLNLGISGGSDYHGLRKPAISLGTGTNNLRLSPQFLRSLKEKCGRA